MAEDERTSLGLDGFDFWRLAEELSVTQAALLIVGADPSGVYHDVEKMPSHEQPKGYEAARTAISSALKRGLILGEVTPFYTEPLDSPAEFIPLKVR